MKKTVNNKRKNLILGSFAVLSIASIASVLSLTSNSEKNTINVINSKNVNELTLRMLNESKTITDNSNLSNLTNPNEVFFVSEDISKLDVWNSTTSTINETNKKKFDALKTNLEKATGPNSDAKMRLTKMVENIELYIKFRTFEQEYKKNNQLEGLLSWELAKEAFIQNNPGTVDEFEKINDLENVNDLLLQISGITNENEKANLIRQITSQKLKQTDLIQENNPTTDLNKVEDVAGTGYNNLIQIAEIDLNEQKNFVLEFKYRKNSTTKEAAGKLILRNDVGQIKNAKSLNESYENLDIFGRYTNLGTDSIGSNSFNSELENFVLKKENDKLIVLARLKDGEIISNVKFTNDNIHGEPTKFGILDIQASDTKTFISIIDRNADTKTLMSKDENENQLNIIQFFSSSIRTTKSNTATKDVNDIESKREITFYQGKDQDTKFKLNFITNIQGNNHDYDLLTKYNNGVNTGVPIMLELPYNTESSSAIEEKTYEFFSALKDKLPSEVVNKFPDISKIYISSTISSSTVKQTISFSDNFYGIGDRATGWKSVNINDNYPILINDLTDKIFFEKPKSFKDDSTTTRTSTLTAVEQINERTQVIDVLGKIYEAWATNDSLFTSQRFNFQTNVVSFNRNGNSFTNISFKTKNINANSNELYLEFSNYWKDLSNLIKTLFNPEFSENENRYIVNQNNTGRTIVTSWLLGNFEYLPSSNDVLKILNESIEIWQKDPFFNESSNVNKNPSYEELSANTKLTLSEKLSLLVELQYIAIMNEFNVNQLWKMYDKFSSEINKQDKKQRKLIKVNEFIEIVPADATANTPQFFKYKTDSYNNQANIVEEGEFTLSDVVKNIISLFNLGKTNPTNNEPLLIDGIINNKKSNNIFRSGNIETFVINAPAEAKIQQLQVYDYILSYFGYSLNSVWTKHLSENPDGSGELELKFDIKDENGNVRQGNLDDVFDDIVDKLVGNKKTHSFVFPTGAKDTSYWMDDIITGANIVNSLNWRLVNSPNSNTKLTQTPLQEKEIQNRINNILIQQQASGAELSAWSNAIGNSWFFNNLTADFSGKNGKEAMISTFNQIVSDKAILSKRTNEVTSASLRQLSESLKYIWFILIALAGVGILLSSSLGLAFNMKREFKMSSSHIVIKITLVSLIILGLALTGLSLGFGIIGIL